MWRMFSKNVQSILAAAYSESRKMGADYIGSEHLMLGIIEQRNNTACRILKVLDICLDEVRSRTLEKIKKSQQDHHEEHFFSARATRIIEISFALAKNLDKSLIGSEHILLGILREGTGVAAKVIIQDFNVEYSTVLKELYGFSDLKIKNFTEAQKTADKAIRELWDKIKAGELRKNIQVNQIREIINLLEYISEQLTFLNREDLKNNVKTLKESIRRMLPPESEETDILGKDLILGEINPYFEKMPASEDREAVRDSNEKIAETHPQTYPAGFIKASTLDSSAAVQQEPLSGKGYLKPFFILDYSLADLKNFINNFESFA